MDYDLPTKIKLLDHLMTFVSEERKKRFNEILSYRTRHITVVLEDIYQPHNASAILRTCDLTGIQDVHIIENKNEYEVNPEVALGASKWINLIKHNNKDNNTLEAINSLKKKGYTVIATTPHKKETQLDSLPIDKKIAFVFGTELTGLSDMAIDSADEHLCIPMFGFTESYNISISAALVLYTITQRLRSSDIDWKLSNNEITDILLDWTRVSINKHELVEQHFLNNML